MTELLNLINGYTGYSGIVSLIPDQLTPLPEFEQTNKALSELKKHIQDALQTLPTDQKLSSIWSQAERAQDEKIFSQTILAFKQALNRNVNERAHTLNEIKFTVDLQKVCDRIEDKLLEMMLDWDVITNKENTLQ